MSSNKRKFCFVELEIAIITIRRRLAVCLLRSGGSCGPVRPIHHLRGSEAVSEPGRRGHAARRFRAAGPPQGQTNHAWRASAWQCMARNTADQEKTCPACPGYPVSAAGWRCRNRARCGKRRGGGLQTMHGGARRASHQCMARNTRDGPCARARQWLPHRQMRPSPGPSPRRCRAPVACNRPCIWSRCAFGWRVDPWVEESQVDGVRISPYTVSEHGVRHCDRATQTVHFKFGLFPGSFMQLNSSQAKTINRVVERVARTSTPAIEWLILPEAFLAWIDSFPF